MKRRMKITEIQSVAERYDFIFAFCTFLDEFYAANSEEKNFLLADEPERGALTKAQHCTLACAAHKLANDYGLAIPEWVAKKIYVMPNPIYAFDTEDEEYQDFLRATSPEEYSSRNIFYGNNVLRRV